MNLVAYKGDEFTIEWYHDSKGKSQALTYFLSLTEMAQNRFLYLLKRMGDFGKISDKTKFRYEGDGIYAFKPKPDRYLCFFFRDKKIIVTNAFVKKSDKLPSREKKKAIEIKYEYLRRVKKGDYYA